VAENFTRLARRFRFHEHRRSYASENGPEALVTPLFK
jgi:hypothetical protein